MSRVLSVRRKRVYKAPKAEERCFKAPQPGSLGSLSYPEFGYVLQARQAAQRAQQAAPRSQVADAWGARADGLEDEHLHNAETFGGDCPPPPQNLHSRDGHGSVNAPVLDVWFLGISRSACVHRDGFTAKVCSITCKLTSSLLAEDTSEEQYGDGAGFADDDGYDEGGQAEELSFNDLADAAASGQPSYDAMAADPPQVNVIPYLWLTQPPPVSLA